jgi:uncharacterized protein (DUF1697 family)
MHSKNIYIALLRGINVGGNTIINMAKLKEGFEHLGFQNVKTYINSGNIIFTDSSKDSAALESRIEKMIIDNFALQVRVVVRNLEQYEKLIKDIPINWKDNEDYKKNVIFLSRRIDSPDIIKDLSPKPEIESLAYHPGVLFWAAKTSDLTKSSMVKLSRLTLYKEMTVRNLNTTYKIYDLMSELARKP